MDTSKETTRPKAKSAATKKLTKARKSEAKRGPGRPAFEPTDEMRAFVEECAATGASHDNICLAMASQLKVKISDVTLRKYFADELAAGAAVMDVKLQHAMCRIALDGNYAALVFLHATRKGINVKVPKEEAAPPPPPPPPVVFTINSQAPVGSLDHLLAANTVGQRPGGTP